MRILQNPFKTKNEYNRKPMAILIPRWKQAIDRYVAWLYAFIFLLILSCGNSPNSASKDADKDPALGCDGQTYMDPSESPYVLPYAVGQSFRTGLTNCSSSYHAPGRPDQYAFDFNMPVGTPFVAARAGTVYEVVENTPSKGVRIDNTEIVGNYVIIAHDDGTYGLYLHSPDNGIKVSLHDKVKQGDVLGETGQSGLAGYPHLHFIVVKAPPVYPYEGIAISFRNARPADVALKSNTVYEAVAY